MTHQVLNALEIRPGSPIEKYGVMQQQLARVIVNGEDLGDAGEGLSKFMLPDKVREVYDPGITDPIKNEATQTDYLRNHQEEFILLWLRVGLRHPWAYLTAWVDQTCKYWNGSYYYSLWIEHTSGSAYGIFRREPVSIASRLMGCWKVSILLRPVHLFSRSVLYSLLRPYRGGGDRRR